MALGNNHQSRDVRAHVMTRFRDLLIGTLLVLMSTQAYGQAATTFIPDAATWRGLGIHPVEPPLPLLDATLPTTQRSQVRLSDARGQWLILSFFATWCGPCKAEFPSMVELWNATHKEGLDLFAISAEDDHGLVQRYASNLGLPFPVLHDLRGQLSANYRVSSLPTSFIVSPQGNIVGRVVGARDWAQLIPALQAIMRGEAPSVMPAVPTELPPLDDPPTATVALISQAPLEVGSPISMVIDVQWSGELRDYLLKPPALPELDGLEVLSTKAKSSARAGSSTVRYEFTLNPTVAQVFNLDPVRLNYRDGRNGAESGTEAKGLKLVVVEKISLLRNWRLWLGLGFIALVLMLGVVVRRRKATPRENDDAAQSMQEALEELRESRIRGEHRRFIAICQELAAKAGLQSEAYITSDLANAVQYGGHRIPEIDLDQIERKLRADLKVSD